MLKITDIINKQTMENKAIFNCYRQGKLYYDIVDNHRKALYQFPVDITDIKDIGTTTFGNEYKVITMMRYIRKALLKGDLVSLMA